MYTKGVAVAAPVFAATGSRGKAFLWSFLSGVSEIAGACLAALLLRPHLSEVTVRFVLASVAGIMVVISLDEMIPTAKSFKTEHVPLIGIVTGMGVMMTSLWMLK